MVYRGFTIERVGSRGIDHFRFVVTGSEGFRFERFGAGDSITSMAAAKRVVDSEIRQREARHLRANRQ